jgi:ribonuclease III family protein
VIQLPGRDPTESIEPGAPSVYGGNTPVDSDNISFQSFVERSLVDSSARSLSALSPISLAYVGDAVFELYVRSRLLMPPTRIRDYHQQVVAQVKAEQQATHVDSLMPYLSEAEKDILRRGRNATSGRHRRAEAKSYQKATGFEALIGFLYLSDQPRLLNLLDRLSI